jgi:single-strand DNA-binding protein
MSSVNKCILIGNLTRDPQTKQVTSGTLVCEFGIAMNRKYKVGEEDREEVCFLDCAAFGRQGEVIQKYCQKGKSLYIEGRLKWDSWDDKNGGGKRSKVSVVVENFQFLGGKDDGGQKGGEEREQNLAPPSRRGNGPGVGFRHPPREPNPRPTNPISDNAEFDPSEVPF